eukprot:6462931-Amphidinium_carterae.1
MGCSWSLYYAQCAVEESVRIALHGMPFTLLGNSREGVELTTERLAVFVYVDNVGVMSTSERDSNLLMDRIVHTLEERQLRTHEQCPASTAAEALGLEVDGVKLQVRTSSKRYTRLLHGLQWALRRKTLSGDQLRMLLGHI